MPAIQHKFSYEAALHDAEKVNWRIEDIIGGDKKLDFARPFLPDSLVGAHEISALGEREKLALNHIRGKTYLYLFGFVEEFILPFVLEHAQKAVHGESARLRSLLAFAEEEAKHIDLFHRFNAEFDHHFGTRVDVIGPAAEIARAVLAHSPLGVVLTILHLEWLTQYHYVESVKNAGPGIDPQFASLLKHHWLEEAQHAKLDTLLADEIVRELSPAEIETGIDDYLKIAGLLEGGLSAQARLDVDALERHVARMFTAAEREQILAAQVRSYRRTFLVAGAEHPNFVKTLRDLSAEGQARVAAVAASLS
jgi:hypothetical protein